jgi:PAS domain S-box-containing protein
MRSLIFDTEVFQKLFDSADDLLFVIDDGGHIIRANAAARRLLGYTDMEIVGKKAWELQPSENRDDIARTVERLLSGEMPKLPGFLVSKDGRRIPVEPRVSHVQLGETKVLFGICRQIQQEQAPSSHIEIDGLKGSIVPETHDKTGKILVVDDEESLLEMMGEVLNIAGYEVLTANRGEKALRMFEKHRNRIALVVLDMIMPGMDGKEVYLKIKKIDPGVKILICSGYAPDGMVESLIGSNRDAFIQKPFLPSELCYRVGKMLHGQGIIP